MTPKEKAKQLYDKMKFEAQFNSQPSTVHGMCKKLALICVDQQINLIHDYSKRLMLTSWADALCYWLDVKQELETL
jgi:hypothetical protein